MKRRWISGSIRGCSGRQCTRRCRPTCGPGARISVLVIEEQYAHPVTPPGQSARIVWFRGLTIGDREVFGLAQTRAWEENNQRWAYLLLALALLGVAYYGVKWLRTR